jgi:excisionase family DNA binding protein
MPELGWDTTVILEMIMHFETAWEQATAHSATQRAGEITGVNRDGLAFLQDLQSGRRYAFSFDKIDGYRGQTVREIGLKVGTRVHFGASEDQITWVQLPARFSPTEMLTVPEVARCLRVSERLVYNMIKRGELGHVRVGRLMRIPSEAVRALVDPKGGPVR